MAPVALIFSSEKTEATGSKFIGAMLRRLVAGLPLVDSQNNAFPQNLTRAPQPPSMPRGLLQSSGNNKLIVIINKRHNFLLTDESPPIADFSVQVHRRG